MTTPNLAALLEKPQTKLAIKPRPIPTSGANELVIRNHAIASNPVDWKMQAYDFYVEEYPTILGSDISGIVHAVGSSVTKFSVGDRVLSFSWVYANPNLDHGAWQTYTTAQESLTCKIPEDMAFVDGAVFPMAMATAAVGLFIDLDLPRPPASVDGKEGILVWGAASSVGTAAVQILKLCGYKVFAIASPNNHEYVKSLGAHDVFDYGDADVVSKIVASAEDAGVVLNYAFDTITKRKTVEQSIGVLNGSGNKGRKLALTQFWPEDKPKPDGIEILETYVEKLAQGHKELGAWFFNEWLQSALEKGNVIPAPKPEVIEGGIENTQKVLDLHKVGVSRKKLVLKVD